MNRVYADYNSTTPLCDDVINHIETFKSHLGNMDSGHYFGQKMHQIYDEVSDKIKTMLGASGYDLFTCSSATEANHWFFQSLVDSISYRKRVIISSIEHSCVMKPLQLFDQQGIIDLQICRVNQNGYIDLDHFKSLLSTDTYFVSIGLANNELGTIQPLAEICELAKSVGAITHSDIVQAVGKIPLNLDQLALDAASMSAHKCYAPTGCGVLLVNNSDLLRPIFFGGAQQQQLRAGTVNVFGLSLFLKGLEYCYRNMIDPINIAAWVKEFRHESENFYVLSSPDQPNTLWNTVSLAILNKDAHDVMMALDMHHIAVSTGSACSTGATEPSESVIALNLPDHITDGVIRISFGYPTTSDQLLYVKEKIFQLFSA